MNKKTHKRIGLIILKSVLLLFLADIIAVFSNALFVGNMFGEEYFSEQILNVWHLVFFLLIFNSLTIAIGQYDKHSRERFLESTKNNKLTSHVKFVISSIDFYVELVCIIGLSVLFVDVLYNFVSEAFFYGAELTAFNNKLYTLLIILPIMAVILFVARITVQRNWYLDAKKKKVNPKKEKKSKTPPVIKSVIIVAAIYCVVAIALPWFFPFFLTLWELGGVMLFVWIAIVLVALVLITVMAFYIRALFKRMSFVKKIKKYCAVNFLSISDIKKPYASIFVSQSGCDFIVEKNGVKYDCKFIAGIFPWAQIVFSDKGSGLIQNTIRLFRIELFHFMTKFEFGYESDGKKILILLPAPRRFFVSENQSSPRPGDVGEKVGEYTIYNSTGFLNALNRDCI